MNKKNPKQYFDLAVSLPLISTLIISAVIHGVNQGQHQRLRATEVLKSFLFGDVVMGNDKDEPKFCNMRFDMDL